MRALVTGGAGFIGSHLVDRLVDEGHEVVVVDNLSTGRAANLDGALATGRCRMVEVDLADTYLDCRVADARPDVVFHLAAQIDVRDSVADPLRDASVNVLGTLAVLDAARRTGVRKVVNVSSVAIYGTCARLPVDGDTPTNPLSPYASSKLAAEVYCHQYQQLYGLPATTVVLTNVYGPRQRPTGAVAIWAEAMLANEPTYLYGDGNVRDYLYVADAVDALVRAVDPSVTERHVEVGTGHPVTDRQLHDAVATAVGSSRGPVLQERRRGDVAAMVVDPTPARLVLGWKPRTSLADGLAATVDHIRTQIPSRRASSAHW